MKHDPEYNLKNIKYLIQQLENIIIDNNHKDDENICILLNSIKLALDRFLDTIDPENIKRYIK